MNTATNVERVYKKIWEVDPLVCPNCTGEMKIISFISKRTVIKKILTHLNINDQSRNQRARPMPEPEYTDPVMELFDDGWPKYEEAVYEC